MKSDLISKEETEKVNNENTPPSPIDPCNYSLSEIYKKCIMSEPKKSIKLDNPIEFYQNNNIFKYGNQVPLAQNFQ